LFERDVFSSEISDLETPLVGPLIETLRSTIREIINLPYVFKPMDCSLIVKDPRSKNRYVGSYWKTIYDYLDSSKKNNINNTTEKIFQSSTKVKRQLNQKKDILLIRQKSRIRDCVTRQFVLSNKYWYVYDLTPKEEDDIRNCVTQLSLVINEANHRSREAFDTFKSIMIAEIDRKQEESFFSKIVYFFVIVTITLLIGEAGPILAEIGFIPKIADTLLGKSIKESAKELISMSGGVKGALKDKPDTQEQSISLTDYLKDRQIDSTNLINGEKAIPQVKDMIVSELRRNSSDAVKKQSIIDNYINNAKDKYNNMTEYNRRYFINELGSLFAGWINASYKSLPDNRLSEFSLKNVPFLRIIYLKGMNAAYTTFTERAFFNVSGFISIRFEKIDHRYKEVYENGLPLSFDKESVKVDVWAPVAPQVTSGLASVIDKSDQFGGIWNNPFDMPISKLIDLRFKDDIEVRILLPARMESGQYIPYYFYMDPSNKLFRFTLNPTHYVNTYAEMESVAWGTATRYNLLRCLFGNLTVPPYTLNSRLPFGENSLSTVKEATKAALLKIKPKLK
jgi:hypothetical protein